MFHQEMRYGGSPSPGNSQMKVVSRLASQALALSLILSLTSAFADEPAPDADRDHRHRHSEIWLAPQSLPLPPLSRDEDFMQMFTPDAPWHFAAAHTKVFKLYGSFLGHATQDQVNTIVADLNRRHIAIGLENGILLADPGPQVVDGAAAGQVMPVNASTQTAPAPNPPPCGGLGRVEGYATPQQATRIANLIKTAGGEIKYLVMDEPLYHGRFSSQPFTCHSSVDTLLRQAKPVIEAYRAVFPDIIIGAGEPTRFPSYPNWQADLYQWLVGLKQITGKPLAFMQLDIPWSDDGKKVPGAEFVSHEPADAITVYRQLEAFVGQEVLDGIGIIHDGIPLDTTDVAWIDDAKKHVRELEQFQGLRPDQDLFQTWMPHPSLALPESDPTTLTSLVDWYVKEHPVR
jgi:hypothetical protein